MGSGMAANLVKVGHTVTAYNRTKERTEPLVALGAKSAKNLADACRAMPSSGYSQVTTP
jgi:3-hydroxyisobutyrate dehydrogenase-like beta-hydroxyacid dehydrogenase